MIHGLRIHLVAIKLALATRMAHRADFMMSASMMVAVELIVPLITFLIYRSGAGYPGWSLYQAMLIQGLFLLAKGIAFPLYFGMVRNTLNLVREGSFDLLLLKPNSPLFMVIITAFDPEELGKLFGGLVLVSVALRHVPNPSLSQWLLFCLLMVLSQMMIFSWAMIMSAAVFKWVGNSRVFEIFDAVTDFGNYPLSIFSKGAQTVLSIAMPVAMIAFFPASVLLGQSQPLLVPCMVMTLVFLCVGSLYWRWMLARYTSAGG
jgi:ABC-2 type transport system permease protein